MSCVRVVSPDNHRQVHNEDVLFDGGQRVLEVVQVERSSDPDVRVRQRGAFVAVNKETARLQKLAHFGRRPT